MMILDSDIMIDLLRQHPPAVAWLDSLGEEEIILPGFGDYIKKREALFGSKTLDEILSTCYCPLDEVECAI